MRKLFHLLIFTAGLLPFPAVADPSACQRPTSVKPFVLDESGLRRQASFINLWWTSDERKRMTHEEAIAVRKKDIEAIYAAVEAERRAAYANASCLVVHTKKCASTPGKRHTCPMSVSPPANMRFEPSTIQPVDDDFDAPPTLQSDGTVTYTVKKTGRGSNTAGFQATAVYSQEYIDREVKAALDQVHKVVDPLLDVDLSGVSQ